MLRKLSSEGIGYSVVGLNDVRHVFAAAVPRHGGSLQDQADDALRTIKSVIHEEGTRGSIVHQAVFVADAAQIPACREIIRDFYGDELPATTYIPQRPCQGRLLSIEALGVGQGKREVEIKRISEQLVRVSHSNVTWVHCHRWCPKWA